jgi:hypothetical protein
VVVVAATTRIETPLLPKKKKKLFFGIPLYLPFYLVVTNHKSRFTQKKKINK